VGHSLVFLQTKEEDRIRTYVINRAPAKELCAASDPSLSQVHPYRFLQHFNPLLLVYANSEPPHKRVPRFPSSLARHGLNGQYFDHAYATTTLTATGMPSPLPWLRRYYRFTAYGGCPVI